MLTGRGKNIKTNNHYFDCFYYLIVHITADPDKFQGFLCQARTDINDITTIVGTLAAAGTYPMKDICGTVRHFQNCRLHEIILLQALQSASRPNINATIK